MENEDANKACSIFNALGDPTRYQIVKILSECTCCVTDMAERVGISPAGVSQQMKLLENANILIRKRDGQKICYEINRDDKIVVEALKLMGEK